MTKKPKFPMKIFLAQVDKIMQEFRLGNDDRAFDTQLGVKNKLYRWRRGDVKGLEIDTLLLISETFGKSLDWLVFGKEPVGILQEMVPPAYDARQPAPVDVDLIAEVVDKTEDWLNRSRLQISPRRKGVLVSMIYENCVVEKVRPDDDIIKAYYLLSRRVP
jgi:hypothetical protein